jgi:hypothetical protein
MIPLREQIKEHIVDLLQRDLKDIENICLIKDLQLDITEIIYLFWDLCDEMFFEMEIMNELENHFLKTSNKRFFELNIMSIKIKDILDFLEEKLNDDGVEDSNSDMSRITVLRESR